MISLKAFIVYSSSIHCEYIDRVLLKVKECLNKKNNQIEFMTLGEKIRSSEIYLPKLEELVGICDLGIVIFDGFRPNVLFEYGYLKGEKKPLILLKERESVINIKTLYRNFEGHGLEQGVFIDNLNNPPLDIDLVLSDINGLHIESYSKDVIESNPDSIQSKIDRELKKLFEKGDLIKDFSLDWISKKYPGFFDEKIKKILRTLALFEYIYTKSNFLEKLKSIINTSEKNEILCEYLDKFTQFNIIIKERNYYHLHSKNLIFELWSEFFQSNDFSRILSIIQEEPYELLYEFSKRIIIIKNFNNLNSENYNRILGKLLTIPIDNIVSDENLWNSITNLAKFDRFQGYILITQVLDFFGLTEKSSDFKDIIKSINKNFDNLNYFASNSIIKDCLDFLQFNSFFPRKFKESMEILKNIIFIDKNSPENYAKDLFLNRCYAHSNDKIWYSDKVDYINSLPEQDEYDLFFKIESISSFCFSPAKAVSYNYFPQMSNASEAELKLLYDPNQLKEFKKEFLEKLFSFLNHTNPSISNKVKNLFIRNFRIIFHSARFQTMKKWLGIFHQSDFKFKFQLLSKLNKFNKYKNWQSGITQYKLKKIREYVNNFIEKENLEFKLEYFLRLDILSGPSFTQKIFELDDYLRLNFEKIISNIIDQQIADCHWIPILFLENHNEIHIFSEIITKRDSDNQIFKRILDYIPKLPLIKNINFISNYIWNFCTIPLKWEKLINLVWNIPQIQSYLSVLLRHGKKISNFQLSKIQELITLELIDYKKVLDIIHHKNFSDLEEKETIIFLQTLFENYLPPLDKIFQFYQIFNENPNLISFFTVTIINQLAIINQYHYNDWNKLTQKLFQDNNENRELLIENIFKNLLQPTISYSDEKGLSDFIYESYKNNPKIIVKNINKIMDLDISPFRFIYFISPTLIDSFSEKDLKSFLKCNSEKTLRWIGIIMKEKIYKSKEMPPFLRTILSIIEDDRLTKQIQVSKESLYTQLIDSLLKSSFVYSDWESYVDNLIKILQSWITDDLSEKERNWMKFFKESSYKWLNQLNWRKKG